uniref:Uncharacterized protein n=1 Tax=Heterorhabditis bacteriophora TaxID=37862 RepID=A0A1I7WKY3_HETBA
MGISRSRCSKGSNVNGCSKTGKHSIGEKRSRRRTLTMEATHCFGWNFSHPWALRKPDEPISLQQAVECKCCSKKNATSLFRMEFFSSMGVECKCCSKQVNTQLVKTQVVPGYSLLYEAEPMEFRYGLERVYSRGLKIFIRARGSKAYWNQRHRGDAENRDRRPNVTT